MIPGAPREARWSRPAPRRTLPAETLERIIRTAFPGRRAVSAEALTGGLRNANFKVALDGAPGVVVLRLYEHHPSLARKEADIFRLLAGGGVPMPHLFHVKHHESEGLPPFTLARFVDAVTFHDLKQTGNREAIAQAARSAGETLAAIGRIRFPKAGWLGPGPAVGDPLMEGRDPMPRFVDSCLEQPPLERRVPAEWRARVHEALWRWAPRLAALDDDPRLVHGDFNRRNLLVRSVAGRWQVVCVLDWEFAVAGSPLADVGSFLRYEKAHAPLVEPCFSEGYRAAGGALPEAWRPLAQLLSLAAICESLTHEDLPEPVARELLELLRTHCESVLFGQNAQGFY